MTLKDKLQHIFNSDYPGTDTFINEVIMPVFGDDIERKNIDFADDDTYREKAAKAGLKKIIYAADINDEEYRANNIAFFDVTVDNNVNVERARVNIQQVIRSIVDHHSHILIVFHYEDVEDKPWRFSYAYKQGSIANTTSAKRYTYVFGRDFRGRTAAERFEAFKKSDHSNKALEEAFSVEALSDEFFDIYRAYYATFVEYITGEKYSDEKKLKNIMNGWNWRTKDTSDQFSTTFDCDAKATRDYIKKMFGRIVFLYFLQRKGWLYDNEGRSDAQYMKHLFDNAGSLQTTFLDDVLEILFFYVLNTKPESRISEARMAHKDVTILPGWDKIPFLNGGLFEQDDIDPKKCTFPAEYFREFFNFLNSYNFTIDENDQEDAEIGIDPEMLGRIFENLLEDNKDKGAFYTPKPIVDYMCRESIIAYLQDDRYKPEGNELIRKFIETLNIDLLNKEQRDEIENKLLKVKICDPAIGSGAFPMGLVNLLSKIFIVLRTYSTIDQAKMKRYIMQQSIYGVDIEKGAVDIARLRFWLAMVVDEPKPTPLPNLHFKIMQGNSLLEFFNGLNLETLMKPETGRIDFITEEERKQLRKNLTKFYAENDHEKRLVLLNEIKNTVIRMILNADSNSPLSGIDVSATDQFFMWRTWFSDVFDNGGFDIVIGNPPYFVYQDTHVGEIKQLRDIDYYSIAFGGKLNAYKLFLALSLNKLAKKNGITCYIFQNSFLGDLQAANLRRHVLCNAKILKIDSFPERDSVKKRVFKSVKMSVCIALIKSTAATQDYRFSVSIWEDRNKITGINTSFSYNEIKQIDKNCLTIPRLKESEIPVILKLLKHKDVPLKCIEGELNMTFHKKFFGTNKANPTILKGASIQRYRITFNMSQGEIEYLEEPKYVEECGNSEKSKHHNYPRIAMQGMTGANDKIRLIMSIVPKGYYLANSCNYLFPPKDYNIYSLLSILNSKTINWFFRRFSTNSNVNGYEVDNFPIIELGDKENHRLSELSQKLSERSCDTEEFRSMNNEIDHIVYHLYDLTYDEVLIIDPETPIKREEYENFKIEE